MAENPPEPFLELEFEEATKFVRGKLAATASSEDLLHLYARFKQAKEGACTAAKPSFYQLSEKSKWSAWSGLGAMSRAQAMNEYVEAVSRLEPAWREEVVVEPTEGWVTVSSHRREEEEGDLTLWDLVKEGSLDQLTAVLDSLQDQVWCVVWCGVVRCLAAITQVRSQLSEQVDLGQLKDDDGLTLLHWAADRGQVG